MQTASTGRPHPAAEGICALCPVPARPPRPHALGSGTARLLGSRQAVPAKIDVPQPCDQRCKRCFQGRKPETTLCLSTSEDVPRGVQLTEAHSTPKGTEVLTRTVEIGRAHV